MKRISVIFLSVLAFAAASLVFQPVNAQVPAGKLEIQQDARLPMLIQKHIHYNNRQKGTMDGFRIQIFFDSGSDSKKRAMDARTEFLAKFPEITAYLTFQEPFYKVRVGDFRLRIEADGGLERIKGDYPSAFTVKDKIYFPKID
ncbi:MAG: SPOR domain-containing protein [Bacteroidales bacterium]